MLSALPHDSLVRRMTLRAAIWGEDMPLSAIPQITAETTHPFNDFSDVVERVELVAAEDAAIVELGRLELLGDEQNDGSQILLCGEKGV